MDAHQRLRQLLDERGWTEYRLSKKCGLSQSTLANIFRRNTVPSISTLEAICDGFGITMSQFFTDGDLTVLTPEQKELFDKWVALTPEQKSAVYGLIAAFTDHS
ncbi:MAG: helix-turn-helix transcriptional regulator [Lachnospiraceae bacterium]|nr:helix-turn-helix transcriptional regulator [Lachnospiraceae bacterium]